MKRFITYLYEYRDGQKRKNTGHVRVDVKGQVLDMLINIKEIEQDNENGIFYIIVRKEVVLEILIGKISMQNGGYSGKMKCDCKGQERIEFSLEDIIGVCVRYENGCYMASCWKDGEESVIANGGFVQDVIIEAEEPDDMMDTYMVAAAVTEEAEKSFDENTGRYQKINLSELYALPSNCWHFSNNSFLLHGFWNYGYLVVKEDIAENEKRMHLGVPGIFEQPEMVMATYFGFTEFEALPAQVVEMEVGKNVPYRKNKENQHPQEGVFGCWFTDL